MRAAANTRAASLLCLAAWQTAKVARGKLHQRQRTASTSAIGQLARPRPTALRRACTGLLRRRSGAEVRISELARRPAKTGCGWTVRKHFAKCPAAWAPPWAATGVRACGKSRCRESGPGRCPRSHRRRSTRRPRRRPGWRRRGCRGRGRPWTGSSSGSHHRTRASQALSATRRGARVGTLRRWSSSLSTS